MSKKSTPAQRFWAKVEKTESCWLWTGAKSSMGHGRFRVGNSLVSPHRYAYELLVGPIPEGLLVCHNCPGGDNPACVNPAHLFLGTSTDNLKDSYRKGRVAISAKGSDHPDSKLNERMVRAIRQLHSVKGITIAELSRFFDVDRSTINGVICGKNWGWLK